MPSECLEEQVASLRQKLSRVSRSRTRLALQLAASKALEARTQGGPPEATLASSRSAICSVGGGPRPPPQRCDAAVQHDSAVAADETREEVAALDPTYTKPTNATTNTTCRESSVPSEEEQQPLRQQDTTQDLTTLRQEVARLREENVELRHHTQQGSQQQEVGGVNKTLGEVKEMERLTLDNHELLRRLHVAEREVHRHEAASTEASEQVKRLKEEVKQAQDGWRRQVEENSSIQAAADDLKAHNRRLQGIINELKIQQAKGGYPSSGEVASREMESLREQAKLLVRSRAEEKEKRKAETKRRRACEHLIQSLRGRVSYLTEVVGEAANVRSEWEVERRVLSQQLRTYHDLSGGRHCNAGGEGKEGQEGFAWVTAMTSVVSGITVLLSVHEVPGNGSLRVTAFDPLQVQLHWAEVSLTAVGFSGKHHELTPAVRRRLVETLLAGLELRRGDGGKGRRKGNLKLTFNESSRSSKELDMRPPPLSNQVPIMTRVTRLLERATGHWLMVRTLQGGGDNDDDHGHRQAEDQEEEDGQTEKPALNFRIEAIAREPVAGAAAASRTAQQIRRSTWHLCVMDGDRQLGEELMAAYEARDFTSNMELLSDFHLRAAAAAKVAELLTALFSLHSVARCELGRLRLDMGRAAARASWLEERVDVLQYVASSERLVKIKTVLKYCHETLKRAQLEPGRPGLPPPVGDKEEQPGVLRLSESLIDDEALHGIVTVLSGQASTSLDPNGASPPRTVTIQAPYVDILQGIILSHNTLTDVSTRLLSPILCRSSALRFLDLRGNHITTDGVSNLSQAMDSNQSILQVFTSDGFLLEGLRMKESDDHDNEDEEQADDNDGSQDGDERLDRRPLYQRVRKNRRRLVVDLRGQQKGGRRGDRFFEQLLDIVSAFRFAPKESSREEDPGCSVRKNAPSHDYDRPASAAGQVKGSAGWAAAGSTT